MGLMLGEFIDEYNIVVVDVFSMPQSGTGVTVEAVDPVFQTKMLDILRATGRTENVVGWYHSHPGFGCWLSSTDVSTQSAFEQMCKRAVAVVVDPIQSVKGKVVIDGFRNISQISFDDVRIVTSNIGYLKKPSFISLVRGLNQKYYSFDIKFTKDQLDQNMLFNLNKKSWSDNLKPVKIKGSDLNSIFKDYCKSEAEYQNSEKLATETDQMGKTNYKKHLIEKTNEVIEECTVNELLHAIHNYIFQ
ncbi:RPN11 [Hepatospora eriocheir]|uniref:RPN11 n=2 Tax=Hepatospora eriocheir TaxID=1081669 RepID=A0A1X0QAN5_9MICR|nr:RPN11 [Hepatospora eriocheir]